MDIFDLSAKITLDSSEFEKGVNNASGAMEGLSVKAVALGNAIYDIGSKAASAFGTLVESAVGGYAEFEQLTGGIDTLFGSASDAIMNNADQAFKTAGISANRYMETATSFAGSLLQSLAGDTEAAAAYADRAITDMSDNANKMGTSMDSIIATYQSLSRGNYAMLDNLKLGYGGTKAELERLLTDADALSDSFNLVYDASGNMSYSFADIVDAIGVVQDKMGITGTTAKEAATTVTGSVDSMKAAWENWLVGLGNADADMSGLTDNLINSVQTVWSNVEPVLTQITTNLGEVFTELTGIDLSGLTEQFSSLTGLDVSGFFDGVRQSVDNLVQAFNEGGIQGAVEGFANAFRDAGPKILEFGQGILDNIGQLLSQVGEFIYTHMPENIQGLIDSIGNFFSSLWEYLKTVWEYMQPFVEFFAVVLVEGIQYAWDQINNAVNLIIEIVSAALDFISAQLDFVVALIKGDFEGAADAVKRSWESVKDFFGSIIESIKQSFEGLVTYFKDIGGRLWEGLKSGFSAAVDGVKEWGNNIADGFKSFFGIHSPSRLFAEYGRFMAEGLGQGWNSKIDSVVRDMSRGVNVHGSVDFASSSLGKSSSAQINTMLSGLEERGGSYNINLVVDGRTLANVVFDPLNAVSKQKGVVLGA